MNKAVSFCILFISLFVNLFSIDLNRSLVEIYTFVKVHDFASPWDSPKIHRSGGSGFVVAKNLVMTNAHVPADSVFIEVRLNGFSKRFHAEVQVIGHDCDLSILRVDDPAFQELALPLEFGEEVAEGDEVTVMGYPLLFEGVSLSKGIVSRTQVTRYVHSGLPLYCTQIDAAVNPGNSGGPVVHDGKVVGVAFQGYLFLQNLSFMIPLPIIEHFLRDAEDGEYTGFPLLGIRHQKLENAHMRKYLGMTEDQSGVMIAEMIPGPNDLQEKDIILKVDGIPVENDGSVIVNNERRLFLSHLVTSKYRDETIELEILRDGEVKTIDFLLYLTLADIHEYDKRPSYFVYGGLVFQPLTPDYFYHKKTSIDAEYYFSKGRPVILLSRVLPDTVNLGYHLFEDLVVDKVNGKEIITMQDLVDEIELSFDMFLKFELSDGKEIILHKDTCDASHPFILQRYGIEKDRSDDLF